MDLEVAPKQRLIRGLGQPARVGYGGNRLIAILDSQWANRMRGAAAAQSKVQYSYRTVSQYSTDRYGGKRNPSKTGAEVNENWLL